MIHPEDNIKLNAVFIVLVAVCACRAQTAYTLRAPSSITPREFERLVALINIPSKVDNDVQETKGGDLTIRVRDSGFLIISKDSSLLSSIRLLRELVVLAEKYGEGKPIRFSELSESSRKEIQTRVYGQFPLHDIGEKTCFSLQAMLGRDVRTTGVTMRTSSAPSPFGGGSDSAERRKAFYEMLTLSPLQLVRKESDIEELFKKLPWTKECVFYDDFSMTPAKLNLERRGLELFQAWLQFELDRIDRTIQSVYASNDKWLGILKGKSARNMDDLSRIAPIEHQEILSKFEENYKNYRFETIDKAREALAVAQITYRFKFTIRVGVEGSKGVFVYEPNG